jgi:hypothetical protein
VLGEAAGDVAVCPNATALKENRNSRCWAVLIVLSRNDDVGARATDEVELQFIKKGAG